MPRRLLLGGVHAARGLALTVAGGDELRALLAALSKDPEDAGNLYEALRRKLILFFTWERCLFPEELADEALARLARRLEQGEPISDLNRYVLGVARLIAKESHREMQRRRPMPGDLPAPAAPKEDDEVPRALDECLRGLAREERDLILRYYEGDQRTKIENRERLAAERNLSLNALRNRALRLRDRLERCVRQRIKKDRDQS